MSTLNRSANDHNSDSEDDLDYVPDCEEQGMINAGLISAGFSQT